MIKRILPVIIIMFMILVLTSCKKKPKISSIKLAYSEYALDIATANVIKAIIDQQTKISVEMVSLPDSLIIPSLANGSVDLSLSIIEPNTHFNLMKTYKDSLLFVTNYLENMNSGLYVPQYSPMVTIDDLNNNFEYTKGKILVSDTLTYLNKVTNETINTYFLANYESVPFLNEDSLLSEITGKYLKNENFCISLYRPHWIFSELKLKELTDPKGTFGKGETASIYARKGFDKDLPQIYSFLKNIKFNIKDVEDLMKENRKIDSDPKANAMKWIETNIDRVNLWITKSTEKKK